MKPSHEDPSLNTSHQKTHRVPGYPMRFISAEEVEEAREHTIHSFDVHGDHQVGVPVRTATPEDAESMGARPKHH